jgi:hypothetical protein
MAEEQPQQFGNVRMEVERIAAAWPRLNKALYPRCAVPRPGSRGTVGRSSRKAATEFTHLHKAIRRQADHLIDHIAEAAWLVAGKATIPNYLRGRLTTLENDWARFSELAWSRRRGDSNASLISTGTVCAETADC